MLNDVIKAEFAIDDTNKRPFEAAKAFGNEQHDSMFNPCCFLAPSGCGKSHLAAMIAYKSRDIGRQVEIMSGHAFWNKIFTTIKVCNSCEDSIEKTIVLNWHDIEVLIIEDLDFVFRNGYHTQLFLAETVERLIREHGVQVVITSTLIGEVFLNYLQTHCKTTGVFPMPKQSLFLRKKIVRLKLREAGLSYNDSIVSMIADGTRNGAQIQGIIEQLRWQADRSGSKQLAEAMITKVLKLKGYTEEYELYVSDKDGWTDEKGERK